MVSHLWNAPLGPGEDGTGTATIGSSEAIMLAVLAMKWKWRAKRAVSPYHGSCLIFPLVLGSSV